MGRRIALLAVALLAFTVLAVMPANGHNSTGGKALGKSVVIEEGVIITKKDGKTVSAKVAHFLPWYYVDDDIKRTNAGGVCGAGYRQCYGHWNIGLYYGGDGNPRVGDHSLQFRVGFYESFGGVGARYRECVQRWYHEQYGQTYFCSS